MNCVVTVSLYSCILPVLCTQTKFHDCGQARSQGGNQCSLPPIAKSWTKYFHVNQAFDV